MRAHKMARPFSFYYEHPNFLGYSLLLYSFLSTESSFFICTLSILQLKTSQSEGEENTYTLTNFILIRPHEDLLCLLPPFLPCPISPYIKSYLKTSQLSPILKFYLFIHPKIFIEYFYTLIIQALGRKFHKTYNYNLSSSIFSILSFQLILRGS